MGAVGSKWSAEEMAALAELAREADDESENEDVPELNAETAWTCWEDEKDHESLSRDDQPRGCVQCWKKGIGQGIRAHECQDIIDKMGRQLAEVSKQVEEDMEESPCENRTP